MGHGWKKSATISASSRDLLLVATVGVPVTNTEKGYIPLYGFILGAYYNLLNRDCNKTWTYMDHVVVEITSHLIPITAMAIY